MANLRIVANNATDLSTCTLSATTANSSYPVSNLTDPARGTLFRTTDATASREIKLTWSADVSVNTVALCRHNLTNSATWNIYVYSTTDWTGTPLWSATSLDAYDTSLLGANATYTDADVRGLKNSVYYHSSTATTAQSLKIVISDTSNPDGYLEASRLFVGAYQSPARNAAPGVTMEWAEDSRQYRTDGGSLRTHYVVQPWRELDVQMRHFSAADRLIWSDLYRYCGRRRDFWFSLYPGDGTSAELENQGQFKFKSVAALSHDAPSHWLTSYTIAEA